jgi:hypothetical protein
MWRFATGPGFSTPASARVSGDLSGNLEQAPYCDRVILCPCGFLTGARVANPVSFLMKDVFEKYLLSLRQDRDDKTELSDRGALESLLNAAAQKADSGTHVIHEAKKVRGSGPDFKVKKAGMILGYVEDKTIGENLDQVRRSDQMKRYMALSNNILLTGYLQFIWIKNGKVNGREIIAFPDDLEGKPKRLREDRVKAVSDLLRGFFSTALEGIAES